ncbi:MAG: cytochrome c3 family protein [Planctomycetota bacterium]
MISCNEVERHRVLTFFFDGVPPLYDETGDTNDVNDANFAAGQGREAGPAWFVHEPTRNCKDNPCHDMSKKPASLRPDFTKEPPELCFDCHPDTDYSGSMNYVHGPVAVGDCMVCHEEHRSKHKHLLTAPVPELCYQCHQQTTVESIPDHSQESYSGCLGCHEGHLSSARGLLKKGWPTTVIKDQGL